MEKRHFYRFYASSELGKQFRSLWNECNKAERAADAWAAKCGAKTFYSSPSAFAGGVVCVAFAEGEQVDRQVWRSVGKEMDGTEQWEPNVNHSTDVLMLPRQNFRPSDTATRIYNKRLLRWQEVSSLHTVEEWAAMAGMPLTGDKEQDAKNVSMEMDNAIFVRYIELYCGDKPEPAAQRRRGPRSMSKAQRRAITLERSRLQLPMVEAQQFYQLLQADLLDKQPEGQKLAIIHDSTPTFFEFNGRYYLGVRFPCRHPELQEITGGAYANKKSVMLQAARLEAEGVAS